MSHLSTLNFPIMSRPDSVLAKCGSSQPPGLPRTHPSSRPQPSLRDSRLQCASLQPKCSASTISCVFQGRSTGGSAVSTSFSAKLAASSSTVCGSARKDKITPTPLVCALSPTILGNTEQVREFPPANMGHYRSSQSENRPIQTPPVSCTTAQKRLHLGRKVLETSA